MANNLIQIKRSTTTAAPTSLANGELAYSSNGDVLYIGANGAVEPIGGKRTPGILTANQALVADGSSYLNEIKTGNLTVSYIEANGAVGTNNQILTSNGTGGVYWGPPAITDPAGSNTQIQFNDSNDFGASNGFTFDKSTNTLFIANTLTVGGVSINSTSFGGTATFANLAYYIIANSGIISNGDGIFVNANNGLLANTSGLYVVANSGLVSNSTGVFVNANTGVTANSSGVFIGQPVANTDNVRFNDITIDGNTVLGSNSSDTVVVNGLVGSAIIPSANNTYDLGSAGLRWKDLYLSGTTIYIGNSTITSTSGIIDINGLTIAANGETYTGDLYVNGNTQIGSNSSDSAVFNAVIESDFNPGSNATYNIGTNLMRWNEGHFVNIHSTSGYFDGTVQISGDLVVVGNVTTTNVASVVVSDPLIYLAGNNYSSDLVDIGFAGNYHQGGTNKHTGVIRHAATDEYYIFKGLTQELDSVLTVNIADPTFALADVNAYLKSGALVSNATTIAITANASVNVAIVANTLTLSTPLATNSGGTGLSTVGSDGYVLQSNGTAIVYSTLDGGTF